MAGKSGWLARALILGAERLVFHPHMTCDRDFQKEFSASAQRRWRESGAVWLLVCAQSGLVVQEFGAVC
ncbi:MAG: hypothetical protein CVT63_08295 [Candidatus Anoxymicrobium japonicum]|uniref:Uncharacterized protein n=1 Tax=Candidatus Anoxymicrobium japonicum TaxID=2013648 RepID=A0A2N3G297_9ACTN|nr:MAG: hypothetical protein CVT63_08295 [Candidatus Anoxymicrobium japonicum]